MHFLTRTLAGRPAALLLVTALAAAPAMGQQRSAAEFAATACTPPAEFAVKLRETDRRLDRLRDRPDAARLQSALLARAFAGPEANVDIARLLACLSGP
jgi:hypothetical protein